MSRDETWITAHFEELVEHYGGKYVAEIHWYEAHGIGRREFKLKLPFLDAYR